MATEGCSNREWSISPISQEVNPAIKPAMRGRTQTRTGVNVRCAVRVLACPAPDGPLAAEETSGADVPGRRIGLDV